jgi:hypothetical protein
VGDQCLESFLQVLFAPCTVTLASYKRAGIAGGATNRLDDNAWEDETITDNIPPSSQMLSTSTLLTPAVITAFGGFIV